MLHLDEGMLHAVIDGEVPAGDLVAIQTHLAGCSECQQRFAEARQLRDEAFGLIERLDPVPVAAVAAAPAAIPVPARRAPRWEIPTAWAATVIAALGLGYLGRGWLAGWSGADVRQEPVGAAAPAPAAALDQVLAVEEGVANRITGRADRDRNNRPADRAIDRAPDQEGLPARKDAPVGDAAQREANRTSPAATAAAQASAPATPPSAAKPTALAVGEKADDEAKRRQAAKTEPAPAPRPSETQETRTERDQAAGIRAAIPAAPTVLAKRLAASADADRGGAQSQAGRTDLLRPEGAASRALPNPADQRRRTISAVTAISALGGSIRLVDGLTPHRFEQQGELVRVIYRTALGVLILEQWRAGELLAYELIPPREAPPDSIRAWESRVR